jgi:hypothetical protein
LVAIITTAGVVLAAAVGAFAIYKNNTNSSPAPATTTHASSSSGHPGQSTAPKLDFVPESSGTVPWCNIFHIKASEQLPVGYKDIDLRRLSGRPIPSN